MPEHVLSVKKARFLVSGGWIYSTIIVLLYAFIPPENPGIWQNDNCFVLSDSFHKISRALFACSVIGISGLVVVIQMITYWKLRRQQQTPIGEVSASQDARSKLYKRAMTTSALITAAYILSWIPGMILLLIADWSNDVDQLKLHNVLHSMGTLGIGQAFCNAIIFKLRNMKFETCMKIHRVFCKGGE